MTDGELIRRARQNDPAAWEDLLRLHQDAAFRLAYLLLGDSAEAEEAAQEAFVRAYRSLGRFDERRPFRPWLMRITANLAKNRRRSLARQWARLERLVRGDPERVQGASWRDFPVSSPEASAQMLWQAVRRLGHADQEVLYLRYFLELDEAETAAAIRVPAGTVKSRLHRARRRLRAIVEAEYPALREALEE